MKKAKMKSTTKESAIIAMIAESLSRQVFTSHDASRIAVQLDVWCSLFCICDAFVDIFNNPLIEENEKSVVAASFLPDDDLSFFRALLNALSDMGQMNVLPALAWDLRALIAKKQGHLTASVTTMIALDAVQKKGFSEVLKQHFGGQVEIENNISQKVLGGFVLRMGNYIFDASLRHDFYVLERQMKGLDHGVNSS